MKILFVVEHFRPYIGGAENLFWALSRELVHQGHEVEVVTTLFRSDLKVEENVEGIQVFRVPCRNRFLFSIAGFPKIWSRIKYADIVHTTSYNAAFPAFFASLFARKKVLVTFHEVWGRLWWQLPFLSFFQRLAYYSWEQLLLRLPFTAFIGVSEFTRKALIKAGISPRRVFRVYNGLDTNDFEPYKWAAPPSFSGIYFGRLGVSKGLNLLLPGMARLVDKYPDAELKLVIPTYPEAMFRRIQQQIADWNLGQQIQLFHDLSRADLFQEVCQSSCVIIPSYSEGFCFVAAEATALGVPVISSERGALPEVVGGTYIPMASMTVEGMAEALEQAYQGRWQERPAPTYRLSDSVQAYLQIYEKVGGQG